ncbi:hypothetical protein T484DRAFT_1915117 [Baffinella frigidus]|nr:hypothetical protein T484DRAFT_1915117 [Cryptophyta sp. CCMP2293]
MDGREAGVAKEAGNLEQHGSGRQGGSRPPEEDPAAIFRKLAKTFQEEDAAPHNCCAAESTAGHSTAPLSFTWAKIRATHLRRQGAQPEAFSSVKDQQKIFRELAASFRVSSPASEPEASRGLRRSATDSAGERSQDEQALSPPRPDQDVMEEDSSPAPGLPAMPPHDVVGTGVHQDWFSLVEETQHPGSHDSTFWEHGSGWCIEAGVDANAGVLLRY